MLDCLQSCANSMSPFEAENAVGWVIGAQMEVAYLFLLDVYVIERHGMPSQRAPSTRSVCHYQRSMQTSEWGSSYFHYAVLSHRWEGHEPLLHVILG